MMVHRQKVSALVQVGQNLKMGGIIAVIGQILLVLVLVISGVNLSGMGEKVGRGS